MDNIKLLHKYLFAGILLSLSMQSQALTCSEVANEAYSFYTSLEQPKNLSSWQDVASLKKTLGTETDVEIYTTYQWGDFTLISVQNKVGRSRLTSGQIPSALATYIKSKFVNVPTEEDALKVLGKPDNIAITKGYVWQCPENNGTMIKLITNNDGKMLKYEGQYCDMQSCRAPFSFDVSEYTKVLNVMNSPSKIVTNETLNAYRDQQIVELIKNHLNIVVQTPAQAIPVISNAYIESYKNIRACNPGTYKYIQPFPFAGLFVWPADKKEMSGELIPPLYIAASTIIHGFQDDQCNLEFISDMMGNKTKMTCKFTKSDIALFTDQEATFVASGNIDTNRPIQAAFNKCQGSME